MRGDKARTAATIVAMFIALGWLFWYIEIHPSLLLKRDRYSSMELMASKVRDYAASNGMLPVDLNTLALAGLLPASDSVYSSALRYGRLRPSPTRCAAADFILTNTGSNVVIELKSEVLRDVRGRLRFGWITPDLVRVVIDSESRNLTTNH